MHAIGKLLAVFSVFALSGCAGLLGIESIEADSTDAAPHEPGGGSAADAGPEHAGGSGGAGSAGTHEMMDSGSPNTPDRDAQTGDTGVGMDSGTDSGADSGADSGLPRGDVHGTVLDYNRNAVPNVVVRIGDATATTDDEGKFAIEDVAGRYDVSLSVTTTRYSEAEVSAWLYVGLTRRDPTLQVYRGLPMRDGDFMLVTSNLSFPLTDNEPARMGWAGPYGDFPYGIDVATLTDSGSWQGPAAVDGMAHALHWKNASAAPHLPIEYLGHDQHPLALDDTTASNVAFDLGGTGLDTGMVSGTVTSGAASERRNDVWVRFADNAAIQVVEDWSSPDSFTYLTPKLANSSLTIAAAALTPGLAIAYVDGVAPGTSDITLALPTPATLIAPAANTANVTGNTTFSWTGPDQVYMFYAESDHYYESFYVVTADKSIQLPVPPLANLPLTANETYSWQVQTHDHHATVDDATGPDGLFDSYCDGRLSGPRIGNGAHTESPWFTFTSAP